MHFRFHSSVLATKQAERLSSFSLLVCLCALPLVATGGCSSESSHSEIIVDQTHWKPSGRLPRGTSSLSIRCGAQDSADPQLALQVQSAIERELTARGFTVSVNSPYSLKIYCTGPSNGTRGFPITGKFCKIALTVSLEQTDTGEQILAGETDGIVEDAALNPWSGDQEDRTQRAVHSAVGKLARYLSACVRHESGQISGAATVPSMLVPESERVTLAVIDFGVTGTTNGSAGQALADICRDVIGKSGQFRLIDRNNVKSVLGEQDFAAAVRCSETSCLVQYGRILEAQKILHGRLSQIGERFVLFLSLTDVNTAIIDTTETLTGSSEIETLADQLPEQALRLITATSITSRPLED